MRVDMVILKTNQKHPEESSLFPGLLCPVYHEFKQLFIVLFHSKYSSCFSLSQKFIDEGFLLRNLVTPYSMNTFAQSVTLCGVLSPAYHGPFCWLLYPCISQSLAVGHMGNVRTLDKEALYS